MNVWSNRLFTGPLYVLRTPRRTTLASPLRTFKQRYNSHQHSMRHRKHRHSTALSNNVWSLKDQDIAFDIKWTVLRKAAAYRNTTRRCNLCIAEKLEIMKADKDRSFNRRSELVSKCRHENQFYLCNFPPAIP